MKLNRKFFRVPFFLIGVLSLSAALQSLPLSAKTEQWDFQNKDNYQFDPNKIEIKEGVARLIASKPYRDDSVEAFDKGTYIANAWATRGAIEIMPSSLYETRGPELAAPLSNRQPGMVALWHLDEPNGTNILDDASRAVAKTSDTQTVSSQPGFGYARLFDGIKSHVFVPHYQNFHFERAFSVEAWIRPEATINDKPQTILSRWQDVGAQKSFALQISPEGKINFLVSPDGAVTIQHEGDTVLSAGTWYHVAAIYTGEELRVFLNGVSDGEPTAFRGPVHASTNPIYFGALINTRMENFYQGVIDEVALYNRALTENEAFSHFGNAKAVVGLWHLNERGGPLVDSSGYGNTANAQGEPAYEVEGKLGTAISLDGKEQYIEVPPSSRFSIQDGKLTLEAWIKPEELPGAGQAMTVISAAAPAIDTDAGPIAVSSGEFSLSVAGPEGVLRAYASGVNPGEVMGRIALMPGVWQHVAATWADGKVKIYTNGILDTSAAYRGSVKTQNAGLLIGMDPKKAFGFMGAIDEVAVFRRAKTETEIAASAGLLASSGIYMSNVKDAGNDSAWRHFSWEEGLPYGKEIREDSKGLLHLYHLNEEGANPVADAKGDIAANPIGTYEVPGIFSRARWFQTKGFDKIISTKNLPSLSTFTISFWFEFASSTPGDADRLFSIGDANPTAFRAADGRIHVRMLGAKEIVGKRILNDTKWHHLAITADGRNLFLYIDGALDGTSPFMSATAQAPLVIGNLKSTDGFQGAIDEFAFFNYALTPETLREHYLSGSLKLQFLTRASDDDSFTNVPWRSFSGNPIGEQVPDAHTVALWHLNDKKYRGAAGEVTDASRFSNHGTVVGAVEAVSLAALKGGISLNGSGDYVQVPDAENLRPDELTLSVWINPSEVHERDATLIDKQYKKGAPTFSSYALDVTAGNRLSLRLGSQRGYSQLRTDRDGEITAGRWNHVAATYNRKEVKLYINGKLKKAGTMKEPIPYDDGPLYLGRYGATDARYFSGQMDEASIFNKALSEDEVRALYLKAEPEEVTGTEVNLDLERGRFFQYQALLSTKVPNAGPVLKAIDIQANMYPVDLPPVSNNISVSFADLTHFREKTGAGHRGAISYQISNDGSNWFYHNGRRWVIANGPNESNTAAQIQTRLRDFVKDVGIGSFYFKSFLHSPTGAEPAEVDGVELEYLPNKLTMTAPNGGEGLRVGAEQVISWNSSGEEIKNVTLEYSKDNFKKDFHEIVKDIPNTGSYTWKVPDDISTTVKVRVSDSLDPRIRDTSDVTFRVTGAFELVSPNWNERWEVGSTQEIRWKTLGEIPEVRLEYSTDEFASAIYPIVDSIKNQGKYSWKVADTIASNIKVRVSDVRDPLTFDQSNDVFAIHGKLAIIVPDAKARWIVGSTQQIRWQSTGLIPAVKLDYRTSQSQEWIVIAPKLVNEHSFAWKVPDAIDYKVAVRVTDLRDESVAGESEPFAITGGLRLTNPSGGENWTAGSKRKIAWQTVGTVAAVNLEYKTGKGDWVIIERGVPNSGEYVWVVPQEAADSLTVRVVDANNETIQAMNSKPSNLIPAFILRSPNGDAGLKIGSEVDIVWETQGIAEKIRLEYSKDGFVKDIYEIISGASNIGRYSWKVPDDPSTSVRFRVSADKLAQAQDISDKDSRIFADFKIRLPKGGEKFEVGSIATLEWKTLGSVPDVKLEYSQDDFAKDARLIAASVPNKGQFAWTVPDAIGTGYSFRVSDVRDASAKAISKGDFAIIGNFRLLSPEGGENYTVGTIVKIAWRGAGTVPVVRIDYSEDDFNKSFKTLTDDAPNTGVFEWTVPDLIGHEFKIRVWDPSHPEAMDTMSRPARIVGGFLLGAPNGGEVLYVGDEYDITWQTSGIVPNVKLDFSSDNFNQKIGEISDVYENIGRYKWQVPDIPSGSYKVRVADLRDTAAYDISNSDFRIRSKFNLLEPNGGEGWAIADKKTIRWRSSGSVPEVNLEYSTDDFASVKTIAKNVPNNGAYEWVIPEQVSQSVKVRVSDSRDAESFDTSDADFRLQGILRLESPVGGEIWKVGERRTITWNTLGPVEGVRLEYSRDGFASESKIIVESMPNKGTYQWPVPDDISSNVKLRVVDLRDASASSTTQTPFTIAAAFSLLAPNGGEVWHASDKREINWATVGTVREVDLEYSADDFKSEPVVIDRGIINSGRFIWEIPRDLGNNFKVRVCDSENPSVCDIADNPFAIRSPLEVVSPKGGESWPVGTEQEVRWNTFGSVPRVAVEYSLKPPYWEWKKLIEELPNQGHFIFRVPDDISQTIRFRVSDYEDETLFSVNESPVKFTSSFKLLNPNGGEKWAAGTVHKIDWVSIGTTPRVRLEYSSDNFQKDIKLIESALGNTGSYDWTVPEDLGDTIKVRILDEDYEESSDVSDEAFKIMPGFILEAPAGGEKWIVGGTQKIRWKTAGRTDSVKLEYRIGRAAAAVKKEAGEKILPPDAGWILIADQVPNTGEYEWQVPNRISKEMRVRVTDTKDPDASVTSSSYFEVRPDILLTYPNGGEVFIVGKPSEIRWTAIGSVGKVKVEYSKDDFRTDIHVIATGADDTHLFTWTPTDDVTTTAKIRVTSLDDPSVMDQTDQPFKILPDIRWIHPAGGEKWVVGEEETLKWDWRGTLDKVRVEYSANDFVSTVVLAEAVNTGSVSWLIPDLANTLIKLKISDAEHPETFSLTLEPVKILPGFRLISPNGGERLHVGEKTSIEWQTVGTSSRIRLEYGLRDGAAVSWRPIVEVARNTGQFDWEVPGEVSSEVKIRVSDVLDGAAMDESDQTFKILARFRLISPKADEALLIGSRQQILWETQGKSASVKLEYAYAPGEGSRAKTLFKSVENFWVNSGSYYWTVPDDAGEAIVLKISDASEPDAFALSEAPFKVRGALEFDLPEDGLNWPVGSVQTLKWNTTGTIPYVALQYSTDGQVWKVITDSVANSGSYGWAIPDDVSLNTKLRILNAQNPLVFDESEQTVAITAKFEFTSPAPSTRWTIGSQETIRWKTTGEVKKVWLEYAADTGWMALDGPVPNTGSYEWTVPDFISPAVKLRVRDGDNAAAFAVSEPFTLTGVLQLAAPQGGEVWEAGSKKVIEWTTAGTIPQVRIDGMIERPDSDAPESVYPLDGSFVISESVPNQGRFEWTVPDKISNHVKIKVTDARDPEVYSISAGEFSLIAKFAVTNPKGSEEWVVGTDQQIVWSSQGTVSGVLLEYSRDDFYRDINLIASGVPNTGAALWTVPDTISKTVKIRISDASDNRTYEISEPFRIRGKFDLRTPEQGEVWKVGAAQTVFWKTTGTIPLVRLEYSRDDFRRDIQVMENSLANEDRYEWSIPDIISNTVKIRISDASDPSVFMISSPFKVEGAIKLKAPLGGEKWQALSSQKILWDTVGTIGKVRIEYSRDDFNQDIHSIVKEAANEGFYNWMVPDDIGRDFKVRVTNLSSFSVYDQSPKSFEIRGALSLTSLAGAATWKVGSVQPITWETIGTVPVVRLDYSRDDFQKDIQVITASTGNLGRFDWTVPDDISENIRLRVSDAENPEVFSTSSQPAEIAGVLRVLSPAKDSILKVGETRSIEWETTGTIPAVRLEYQVPSPNDPEVMGWQLISGSVENDGEFRWKVPNDIAREARVRVSDAHDEKILSVSEAFSIIGQIGFLNPRGGERWIVGSKHDLLWEGTGTIPEVKLEYSSDGFKKDIKTISELLQNTGRYIWTVPDTIHEKLEVRISDSRFPQLSNQVSEPFAIIGDFAISNPVTPGIWKVGSDQKIEWETLGTIPFVKLEYSTGIIPQSLREISVPETSYANTVALGYAPAPAAEPAVRPRPKTEFKIIQDKIPNEGFFVWRVPDQIASDVVVRISDSKDAAVAQATPAFKIEGAFEFMKPSAEDVFTVAKETALEWKTTGSIPKITLEYSADGFQRDIQTIARNFPNENKFLWKTPDAIGKIQVRIKDAADERVSAVSPEFRIRGLLEILRPASAETFRVGSRSEIRWIATGTIPQVRLEFSTDNFETDVRLIEKVVDAARLPNSENMIAYAWTVPDAVSGKVRVRVSDTRDPATNSVSEIFKIHAGFNLTSPRGQEIWTVGSKQEISWSAIGSVPSVRLEYSRDGFKRESQVIADRVENLGTYQWTVADAVSSQLWVRVVDERDPDANATHTEPISVQGALELLAPESSVPWRVGDTVRLEWKTTGTIPEVRLEYFTSAVEEQTGKVKMIADRVPNQGSLPWLIPDDMAPQVKIRVLDAKNPGVFSQTAAPVKVFGQLKVLSPEKPVQWRVGTSHDIVWTNRGFIPQVRIEYSRDDFQNETGILFPLLPNTGTVKWTVADLISKNFKIRVVDAENPEVNAVSAAPVEIAGSFNLLTPTANAVFEVGASEEISWQTVGSIDYVQLEYSRDQFVSDVNVIEAKTPNSGRYQWTVPDDLGERFWIRVSDYDNHDIQAVSQFPFSIRGRISLKKPLGGEIWKVGTENEILWDTRGSISTVAIEYSTDDFLNRSVVAQNVPNVGKYVWKIPDIVSEKLRIRVRDARVENVFASTPLPIKISGDLEFVSPQGAEFWEAGSQRTILWKTTGTIPYVSLEYSTDNFASVVSIISGLSNQGRFQWTLPDITSDHLIFRLLDAKDQSVAAVSEPLAVGGTLTLLSPSGGEVWKVGDAEKVQWKSGGSIPQVRLEVSEDDFQRDVQVIESSLVNDGSYEWKVPNRISRTLKIRVSDVRNSKIADTSDASFKITGALEIISPKGGETWQVGSRQAIEWQTRGTIPVVRIESSYDNFMTTIPVAMNLKNSGHFSFEVPDLISEGLRFRVSDATDPGVASATLYDVTVEGGLKLMSPKGGEVWEAQSSQPVTWNTIGTVASVNLEYSTDNFNTATSIASSIPNTGSFNWTVPDISTRNLKLRVVDALNSKVMDQSQGDVQVQGLLKLVSPAGGEIWIVGTERPIAWTSTGQIRHVRIEFSKDNFRSVFPVALSVPNSGSFQWKVPDRITREAKVRVTDDSNPSVTSESVRPFEIRGGITLLSPSGGELWTVGSRHPISWQTNGSIPQVRLEYSTDNFTGSSQAIVPALANKGVYYWDIPSMPAKEVKVRVTDAANPEVFDVSKESVRLAGELELLAPLWGEAFQVGERLEIKWRSTPNIANVKLEYSLDNFETTTVISNYLPNSGRFVWNIPNLISDNLQIRVSDAENEMVYAASKAPIQTHGALKLLSPKGGEVWQAGSRQSISWETLGNIEKVRIEYSSDNFKTSLPIAASMANSGSYDWMIPEVMSPEIRVRVLDANSPSIQSTSEGAVNIAGKINLIAPAGGERWVAGEERILRWQTTGNIPSVDLEYSKDNFDKDSHLIASAAPNAGSFSWKVPNDPSAQVWIRVRSSSNMKTFSVSEVPFQIDYYRIRWMVRDAVTGDHLTGLILTDSTGKTRTALGSPLTLEYPYGIYTTVWTKPGYAEFRSTWLADKDQSFSVSLEPQKEALEVIRASFDYDRARDLVKIKTWYEKDAKPVAAVVQSEVRIYEGTGLIKTLHSVVPDSSGYFQMVWDTSALKGDARYLASATITLASGKMVSSPMSYQIDIPVKETREPNVRRSVSSAFLKPLGAAKSSGPIESPLAGEPLEKTTEAPLRETSAWKMAESSGETFDGESGEAMELVSEEAETLEEESSYSSSPAVHGESGIQAPAELVVPGSAIINETISISYTSGPEVRPVIDIYDANRKLFVRSQPMEESGAPGSYQFLLPIRGISFIPGKPVRVAVIERATGVFKSAEIMIESSPSAMGWEQEIGGTTVLEVLNRLERLIQEIRIGTDIPTVLSSLEENLSSLAGVLTEASLNSDVMEKLNRAANELSELARRKGYDVTYLVENPLRPGDGLDRVSDKMRHFQNAISMLESIYAYHKSARGVEA